MKETNQQNRLGMIDWLLDSIIELDSIYESLLTWHNWSTSDWCNVEQDPLGVCFNMISSTAMYCYIHHIHVWMYEWMNEWMNVCMYVRINKWSVSNINYSWDVRPIHLILPLSIK